MTAHNPRSKQVEIMNPEFVAAVCELIDAVLIEHCLPIEGDEGIINEQTTIGCALTLLRKLRAAPEFSSRHQWANKRLLAHADDYTDPDEVGKIISQFWQQLGDPDHG
jgi:hypothetical protein